MNASVWPLDGDTRFGTLRLLAAPAVVGLGYYFGAALGVAYGVPPEGISVLWPPNAVLLCALLLSPPRAWWAFILAIGIAEVVADVPAFPLLSALGFACVNALEATAAALLLRHFLKGSVRLHTIGDFFLFVICAPVAAAVCAAFLGAAVYWLGAPEIDYLHYWRIWWFGDALGLLLIAPALLAWLPEVGDRMKLKAPRAAEAVLLAAVTIGVAYLVFASLPEAVDSRESLYLLFPPLAWAAVRFTVRGASLSLAFIACIAIWFATQGQGPFASFATIDAVMHLQGLLAVCALTTFTIAYSVEGAGRHRRIVEEEVESRRQAERLLEQERDNLTALTRDLRRSEARYRDLVAGSIQGILLHRDFKPLYANQAAARIFGYASPDEIIALESTLSLCPPAEREGLVALKEACLRGERWPADHESKGLRRDGTEIWLNMQVRVISWMDEPALQATIVDITERKRAEQQLQQAQKLEAIGKLTGGVAHDFNNLMATVRLSAELLGSSVGDDYLKLFVERIERAVERGAALTDRLLAFARKQSLSPRPSDVGALIGGLEDMLRRTLGETIELRYEGNSDLWPALIDPHQFENALLNLAINARDAMPQGGHLAIETANVTLDRAYAERSDEVTPGNYVKVAVRDTGIGMSAEVQENAFEPFFTTKEVGQGSGLGLSMVYGFAKQSKGHVAIDSAPGEGTTVTLYVPRSLEAPARSEAGETAPAGANGAGRILVVEDDEDLCEVSSSLLQINGYDVVTAADGPSALARLESGARFDLLFTDLVLPGGMNGAEIAEAAKRLQPAVKVVYTTGYAEIPGVEGGAADPDSFLLKKPYEPEALLGKVRLLLEGVSCERQS